MDINLIPRTCGHCTHFYQYRGCSDGECVMYSCLRGPRGLVVLHTEEDVMADDIECTSWVLSDEAYNNAEEIIADVRSKEIGD